MAITSIVQQKKEAAIERIALQNDAAAINRLQLTLDSQLLAQTQNLLPLVYQLYIGYYGRPPTLEEERQWFAPTPIDAAAIINPAPGTNPLVLPATSENTPTGLLNYLGRGGSPQLMAEYLGSQPEYYTALGTNPLLTLYGRLFGRAPTPADIAYWQGQNVPLVLLPYRMIQMAGDQDAYWLNQKVALAQMIRSELAAGLGSADYPDAAPNQPQIAAAIAWALARVGPNGKTPEAALLDFRHLLDPTALTPLERLNAPATQSEYQSTLANLFLAYLGRPIQLYDADNNPNTPLPNSGSEYQALINALARANGDPAPVARYLATQPLAQAHLGLVPSEVVAKVYQTLFGRLPSPEESSRWLTRYSELTPWEIASSASRTPSDLAVQAQRTAFLWQASELFVQRELDAANPLHTAIFRELLPSVGRGMTALDALYLFNTRLGMKKEGPATIEAVFLSGEAGTLTILFNEAMGWQIADRNRNGILELNSEIQIEIEGRYKTGPINNQGGGAWTTDPVPNPLGQGATIASFESTRLVLKLGQGSGLLQPRTVKVDHDNDPLTPMVDRTDIPHPYRILITGLPDATGEYGNIIWQADSG